MGAPLFQKATINLENGKQFTVTAPANNADNRYIQSVQWQGKTYAKNWLSHSEILKGGNLQVQMSATPNKNKGTTEDAFPYSFTDDHP